MDLLKCFPWPNHHHHHHHHLISSKKNSQLWTIGMKMMNKIFNAFCINLHLIFLQSNLNSIQFSSVWMQVNSIQCNLNAIEINRIWIQIPNEFLIQFNSMFWIQFGWTWNSNWTWIEILIKFEFNSNDIQYHSIKRKFYEVSVWNAQTQNLMDKVQE